MEPIKSYRQLHVWNKIKDLIKIVYSTTHTFPVSEQYELTKQMRRSVISIASNLAEGHGRNGTKEYIQFLSIAIGSASELGAEIIASGCVNYINPKKEQLLLDKTDECIRMLRALKNKLSQKL